MAAELRCDRDGVHAEARTAAPAGGAASLVRAACCSVRRVFESRARSRTAGSCDTRSTHRFPLGRHVLVRLPGRAGGRPHGRDPASGRRHRGARHAHRQVQSHNPRRREPLRTCGARPSHITKAVESSAADRLHGFASRRGPTVSPSSRPGGKQLSAATIIANIEPRISSQKKQNPHRSSRRGFVLFN